MKFNHYTSADLQAYKLKLILFLFVLLYSATANAQAVNNQIKDVVMPSPNAASLGKYGDIPVSYNTGVPNIGIPIHTLSEGSISLPISLSYHAGGIKVGEPSSWVGQNWSLSAGGMISRTVQGRADESCGGYFDIGNQVGVDNLTNCINTTNDVDNVQLASGTKDGEPDIFSFSIGGYSGKFYIEAPTVVNNVITKGKAILIPRQDVKVDYTITPSGNCSNIYRLQRFTLTMPDGVKYEFGSCDNSTDAIEIMRNNESNFWQASGWYLKKITSADGVNSIVVNYTQEEYRYNYRASQGAAPLTNWPRYIGGYNQNFVDMQGFRLNFIQTSTEKVTFIAGAERVTGVGADLTSILTYPNKFNTANQFAKRLDSIKIENGSMSKKFALSFSYFEDNDATHKSSSYSDFRLKLDAVQEQSGDGTISVPAHTFTYYGKAGNINYLPNRMSSAIDHWGYNNDALANPHTGLNIPYTRLKYTPSGGGNPIDVRKGSSNRETNEESMKWGTIQQIQYPTGGNTVFEYEANTFSDPNGEKALQDIGTMNRYWSTGNCYQDPINGSNFPYNSSNVPDPVNGIIDLPAVANSTDLDNLFYSWSKSCTGNPVCSTGCPGSVVVRVYNANTLAFVNESNYDLNNPTGKLKELFPSLTTGIPYKFVIYGNNWGSIFKIQKEITVLVAVNRKVGGLRIKTLTNYNGINTASNVVKTYTYDKIVNSQTQSTGVLYQKPVYGYIHQGAIGQCTNGVPAYTNFINHFFMDESIAPLGTFEGGHINYDRVQENQIINAITKLSTVYEYQNETIAAFAGFPITPTKPRIGSGEIRKKGSLNSNGAEIASETYTPYTPYNTLTGDYYEYGAGTYIKFNTYLTNGDPNGTAISFWKKYTIRTRPYRLSQVVSVVDNVTTTTNFTYNQGLLPKKAEDITNSNGQTTTTTYFYASELGLTDLVNRNMIGFPVKVKQQTGNAVKWSKVEYALFNGSTQLEPQYLKECFDANETNWITRLYISAYTANGMPSSVFKNNFAVPENYSWSNKLLTQKQFGTGTNLLTWLIAYKTGTSLVEKVTDENGLIKKFTYDKLSRLTTLQDRMKPDGTDVQATTTYDYHYKGQSTTNSVDINSNFVGTSTTFVNATNSTPLSTKQYLDGLGRGLSTVRESYTPGLLHQKNNVTYDVLGRSDRSYLPFESGSLGYEAAGSVPYAFTTYEASPLSRPLKQTNVDGTGITISYGANVAADNVRKFTFTPVQGAPGTVVNNNVYYADNDLYKTCTWNENGTVILPTTTTVGKTEIYKDKLGRVILTRKFLSGQNVDTYNIYDDYSNLVMVIPPGAADGSGNPIGTLVFTYTYDSRNRLIEKKVPNAAPQKFFYDDRDLLTLTQDGNMRTAASGGNANKYLGTQYNTIGQVVKTGWVTTSTPLSTALAVTIADVDKLTETQYYPNSTWVKHQGAKVLKPSGASTLREFVWSYIERRPGLTYTGNPVWTGKQHLLSKTWLYGTTEMGDAPITDNDYGGVNWAISAYDGTQKPTRSINYLFSGPSSNQSQEVRQLYDFVYDNGQRLKQTKYDYSLFGAGLVAPTYVLSDMNYNYKDQVIEKNTALVASTGKYLQSTDFAYNLRGWLTSINSGFQPSSLDCPLFISTTTSAIMANYTSISNGFLTPAANLGESNPDLFTEKIRYDDPNINYPGAGAIQRNGNISQIETQVEGREAQGYSFKYDDLDRLTESNYTDIHTAGWASRGWSAQYETDNKFQEKQTYDLRGNIQTLNRNGLLYNSITNNFITGNFSLMDNLTYTYNPSDLNKLDKVTDASTPLRGFKSVNINSTYTYDANGNLISDLNKNITGITYNYLNLPLVISFTGNNRIEFIYDATGAKLRKTTYVNNVLQPQDTRDYVNGVEYKGGIVDRFAHTEGAVVRQADGATFLHEYTIKDHLGNARVTYSDANNDGVIAVADIKQINHFYPFGLNMEGNWNGAAGSNKYQYNGKEWNDDFGLGLNDYGARFYDPAIARWTAVDPLSEKYKRWSSYNYGMNNPIKFVDPTGMASEAYGFGMQNYEKSQNQIMDEQSAKAKENNPDYDKNKVELFYTNDTESMNASTRIEEIKKMTTAELISIISKAGKIMQRNGIKKNITFKSISAEDAKKHKRGDKGYGFVALISDHYKAYGNSSRGTDGTIGVYNGSYFDSWVNYGIMADERGNFPDPLYGAAFGMAHEYLHQLLYFASTALDNDPLKFDHDDSATPNLNTDGGADRNKSHHVKYPLYPGNAYEIILPAHKAYLQRYFEYLKNKP